MPIFATYDLKQLAHARTSGKPRGITSICSAHRWVLEAAMLRMRNEQGPLLIEATCNQVNQFGGYTGMTPARFREYVLEIANKADFPTERILLGGDHLGPYPWRNLPAEQAMNNALDLVRAFVAAGFQKIHLDASMACSGDPVPLPGEIIASRAAVLARAAESARQGNDLRYVIGTEVPAPGGSVEELSVSVTCVADAEQALIEHERAFKSAGVGSAWENVIALVTQPGVEFGHEAVVDYDSSKAQALSHLLDRHKDLVFEAHSTDYQRPRAYRELVADGFSILKVGPALTYAMRQAIFALISIERLLIPEQRWSNLDRILQQTMQEHPEHWKEHYTGPEREIERMMIHSYSDRIRYYWNFPEVEKALSTLLLNLNQVTIPETLLSDYLPAAYTRVRNGELANRPVALIHDKICEVLDAYVSACSNPQ